MRSCNTWKQTEPWRSPLPAVHFSDGETEAQREDTRGPRGSPPPPPGAGPAPGLLLQPKISCRLAPWASVCLCPAISSTPTLGARESAWWTDGPTARCLRPMWQIGPRPAGRPLRGSGLSARARGASVSVAWRLLRAGAEWSAPATSGKCYTGDQVRATQKLLQVFPQRIPSRAWMTQEK